MMSGGSGVPWLHRCVGGAVLGLALVAAAVGAVGAAGGTRASEENATVVAAAQTKRYAYKVQALYTLTRDTVDPATSLRVSVERRLEAEFRLWANISEDQVYTGTSGDYAEIDGKAIATVRDERSSPPCSQTVEAKGRIGLKFATSRTPLTLVYLSWSGSSTTLPRLPCAAPEIEQWETGVRGKGDWTRVYPGFVWYESRAKFLDDLYRKLAAGRNAELVLTFPSPRQQSGVTERAVLRLQFNRWAEADPKPPKPSSKPVTIGKPRLPVTFVNETGGVGITVSRGGDPVGVTRVTCSGRIAGGPTPRIRSSQLSFVVNDRAVLIWPYLAPLKGQWVTQVGCSYELDGYYAACGKTLRGAARIVIDGKKTFTKQFSFPWKDPKRKCL